MTARLLTTLALALPLAACAAQPGTGQAAGRSADAAPTTVAAPAAQAPAPAPVVTEPAVAPAQQASQQVPQAKVPAAPAKAQPRAMAGSGAPSAAAPASVPAQAPAVQPDTTAPAVTATPAAPDVVAPRPAAPGAAVPPVTMPAGSSTGSLLQTLFALIVVLAVLGALAWFLKRYGPKVGGGNANLRVVGSLNLGGRERIVVVEVGNEWIVVGASPGRINALATMPRQDGQNGDTNADAALAPHGPAAHSFADWLKQTIDKRK